MSSVDFVLRVTFGINTKEVKVVSWQAFLAFASLIFQIPVMLLQFAFKRIALKMCNSQMFCEKFVKNGIFEVIAHCNMCILTGSGMLTNEVNNPPN